MNQSPISTGTCQLLSFQIGGEVYAVDILKVQEIEIWEGATPLPNTPPCVRGVMNLRGEIIPVIELQVRLGLTFERPEIDPDEFTQPVVIVFRLADNRVVGALVDGVSDVHEIAAESVRDAPGLADLPIANYVLSLVPLAESHNMLVILDIERILAV